MPDVKGIVTHKFGPLPVWAYVVIGAGGVFLFTKMRGSSGGGSSGPSGIPIASFVPGGSSSEPSGAVPAPSPAGAPPSVPGSAPIDVAPILPITPPAPVGVNPPATAGALPPTPQSAPVAPQQAPGGSTASPVVVAAPGQFPGVPAGAPVSLVTAPGGQNVLIGLSDAAIARLKAGVQWVTAGVAGGVAPQPVTAPSVAASTPQGPPESGLTSIPFDPVTRTWPTRPDLNAQQAASDATAAAIRAQGGRANL